MSVALIHDWLTGMRGGEKVLETLCGLLPDADIHTLVHLPGSVSAAIESRPIITSFVQNLPGVKSNYRSYLPLFPTAVERFDLSAYDLVLSSSHCVAKGVIPRPDAFHLCYCHTPMRYVWDQYPQYFAPEKMNALKKRLVPIFANYLRMWDVSSSVRVDRFVANSSHVAGRILKYYGRRSDVVHPPVATAHTRLSETDDGYYLIVSAFAPYKRIDLAIAAFNQLNEKLVIVGSGPEEKRLKALAGPHITFTGWIDAQQLNDCYARCRALIFPGEEDFGMVPVEAQCWGKPVIAFGRGGSLETIAGHWADSVRKPAAACTGLYFRNQTVQDLIQAVEAFSRWQPNPKAIRKQALRFDTAVFIKAMNKLIQERERL